MRRGWQEAGAGRKMSAANGQPSGRPSVANGAGSETRAQRGGAGRKLGQENVCGEWNNGAGSETRAQRMTRVQRVPCTSRISGLAVDFRRSLTVPSTVQQFAKPRRLLVGQSTGQFLRSKPPQPLLGW
jgi:hypothetical protein